MLRAASTAATAFTDDNNERQNVLTGAARKK